MTNPDTHPTLPADELLRHARWLRGLARSLVLDDAEADDLVQETWLQALTQDRSTWRDPRAWLGGVARNVARNRGRSQAARRVRERSSARSEAQPSPLDGQVVLERQRALLDRVEALEEPYRTTLLARYFEGLPPRAIASRDGVPVATVKSRLARALDRLRSDLDVEHGDRRQWALWLLPLARNPKATALAARVGLAAATFAALAAAVVLVLQLRGDSPENLPTAPAGSDGPMRVAGADPVQDVVDREPPSRRPVTASSELLVRVLDGEAPVEGARVRFLDSADLEAAGDATLALYPDFERIVAEHGRESHTDAAGEARLPGRAPWFVRATMGARVASGGGDTELDELGELELRLAPAPWVAARVEDDRGRAVAGVPVTGRLELDTGRRGVEPEAVEFGRVTEADGTARFLDPMGFWSVPVEAREGHTASWSELRIDLPGVPESTPRGRLLVNLLESEVGSADAPACLVLPPTGTLEVRVRDSNGQALVLDGDVRLETVGGRRRSKASHETPLAAGSALYSRVALGQRYRATVRVPELGATWVAEGAGPLTAGERTVLEVLRPQNRVWTATIVDEDGAPVSGARAVLYLEDAAFRLGLRPLGPLRTGADGALWVELPEEAEPLGPFHLDMWHGVGRAGVDGVATGNLDAAEVDLGRHVTRFGPTPVVRGRCVDTNGGPLAGLSVSARTRSGIARTSSTAADGTFDMAALFLEPVVLEVMDPSGEWLTVDPAPVGIPDGEEVEIVLTRGGALSGRLVVPEFVGRLEGWSALAYLAGAEQPSWGEVSPTGEIRWTGLAPGSYRLEILMLGNEPLVELERVRIRNGENTDARVEAIDLGALLRRVSVVAHDPEGGEVRPSLIVAGEERVLHVELPGSGSVLVPTAPGWSLFVVTPGWLIEDLGEVTALGDEVVVELRPGLEVELVPRGTNDLPGDWSWEADGPLGRVAPSVSIPAKVRGGEADVLRFGAAGRYRLTHQEASGDGDLQAVSRRETSVTIDVRDDLLGVQRVDFDWE